MNGMELEDEKIEKRGWEGWGLHLGDRVAPRLTAANSAESGFKLEWPAYILAGSPRSAFGSHVEIC
jgi:hypothetical protein